LPPPVTGVSRDIDALGLEVEQRPTSVMTVLTLLFPAYDREVGFDHLLHQLIEGRFVPPAKSLVRLGGIAEQEVDLRGPEIAGVEFY
jgi:hypothetical protein